MTKKQAREGVLPLLTEALGRHGFKFVKKRGVFLGPAGDFRRSFSFHEVDTGDGIEFRPGVGLRSEQIENMIHRAVPESSPDGLTLGSELGRLSTDSTKWRPIVRTEQDFRPAADLMMKAFEELGLPFYEKTSSLQGIDAAVNADPEAPVELCGADEHRAQIGVVVAKLLGRADLEKIIDAHRRRLHYLYKRDVPEFEQFLIRVRE